LKIDTNRDAVADRAYRVRFSSSAGGTQTWTLRRVEGVHAAGTEEDGQIIVQGARYRCVENHKRRMPAITDFSRAGAAIPFSLTAEARVVGNSEIIGELPESNPH